MYEGPQLGDAGKGGKILVVEDDSSLVSEVEELDLNNLPIQSIFWPGWNRDSQSPDGGTDLSSVAHTAGVPVLRPRRVLSVSGIVVGRGLPISIQDIVGRVNELPFPAGSIFVGDKPLPKGFWLCTRGGGSVERGILKVFDTAKAAYRFHVSFTTKIIRDWSSYIIHRNLGGRVPDIVVDDRNRKKIQDVMALPYSTDQINASGIDVNANGFCKVGMYPTVDFASKLVL